jgi:hypothetical protein
VFSPTVWAGIIVAGASAVLFVVSGLMRSRGIGVRRRTGAPAAAPKRVEGGRRAEPADPDDTDDMADIEAILKKHGI